MASALDVLVYAALLHKNTNNAYMPLANSKVEWGVSVPNSSQISDPRYVEYRFRRLHRLILGYVPALDKVGDWCHDVRECFEC